MVGGVAVRDRTPIPVRWRSTPSMASPSTANRAVSPSTTRSWTPGTAARAWAGPARCDLDGGAGEVPHLGQGAALHDPPGAHDADPVAQRLDLGEDVAGEQHGAAVAHLPGDAARGRSPPSAGRGPRSARRGAAARRRRRARPPGPPSAGCPWSRRGPSWWGRGRTAPAGRRGAPASSPPRRRPSRSITSPPVRLGHRVTSPGT